MTTETITLTAEQVAALRQPFDEEAIGKLPKIWCGACRKAERKICDKHEKVRCDGCRNFISAAHIHVDYVGHAEVTQRLLEVDPLWTWEPLAFDEAGLPRFDGQAGLWIRLTVAGMTRLGYGSADGKKGPDAVKETIGDAIRNAAMRFGVALHLWGATVTATGDGDAAEKANEALGPGDLRDVALAAKGDRAKLGPLYRQAKRLGWLGREVTNESGDEEQLGALIQRLGEDQ